MISWIVITILVIVGIVAIKMNHLRHRVFIIILILFALFLYTSVTVVSEKNKLDLQSTKGVMDAFNIYTGWLANGFTNFKDLTAKAVKMDWSDTNGTFKDDNKKVVSKKRYG